MPFSSLSPYKGERLGEGAFYFGLAFRTNPRPNVVPKIRQRPLAASIDFDFGCHPRESGDPVLTITNAQSNDEFVSDDEFSIVNDLADTNTIWLNVKSIIDRGALNIIFTGPPGTRVQTHSNPIIFSPLYASPLSSVIGFE
jgi:hypothetical protein